jgi:phage gp46-like protein
VTDIRIKEVVSLEAMTMDMLLLPSGQLDTSEELATAIRVALGTNGLANEEDVLPDPDSTDRQGWWGDYQAQEIWGGWAIGSRHWLLRRAKITDGASAEGPTVQRARDYTVECLQPFVDQKVITSFEVISIRPTVDRIYVTARIFRGPKEDIALRFQILWQEMSAGGM